MSIHSVVLFIDSCYKHTWKMLDKSYSQLIVSSHRFADELLLAQVSIDFVTQTSESHYLNLVSMWVDSPTCAHFEFLI